MADSKDLRIASLEAELAALRVEMQDFSYTVSHDLRAPLRHIVSYAHLVQEDAGPALSPEVQGFLETITDSARHMGVLMDGLMDLARISTLPVNHGPVPLQVLVQEVVKAQIAQHPQRNIVWRVSEEFPHVQCDAGLLRQALAHVLDNAIKFTARVDAPQIHITMAEDALTSGLVLCIGDNGAGYNPAMQQRLFHPFQRLHTQQQFDGIGMGLALTRKLLRRMGADVDTQGAVGTGCTVRITLNRVQ